MVIRLKKVRYYVTILIIMILAVFTINFLNSNVNINVINKFASDSPSKLGVNSPNDVDIYALMANSSVFESDNGSVWNFQGNATIGYEFVSIATDGNNTYILTNNGEIWRHPNATWTGGGGNWVKLQVSLPRKTTSWVSIDVNLDYIYVLHSDGDVYRIPKSPWPNPGVWVQSSNPIPQAVPAPLLGGETSFVSIAVDWNDSFCFVLRNNGEVYRHECDSSFIWGFSGSWTSPGTFWDIYASYGNPAPYTLWHADGSGQYWGIPSTGWVSIDVFDNYYEKNYTVYVLHSSGLVASHTNLRNWNLDDWLNPMIPWVLDPRWPLDWPNVWGSKTNFVSIACNDQNIFIMQNTGDVYWIPEGAFTSMLPPFNSWLWNSGISTSPLATVSESKTSALVSI
ncbi:MAG: hypothetical protein ACTSPQ_11965 [Candidatus Helarchaeota archaeon]